jgi:hypothetical protein
MYIHICVCIYICMQACDGMAGHVPRLALQLPLAMASAMAVSVAMPAFGDHGPDFSVLAMALALAPAVCGQALALALTVAPAPAPAFTLALGSSCAFWWRVVGGWMCSVHMPPQWQPCKCFPLRAPAPRCCRVPPPCPATLSRPGHRSSGPRHPCRHRHQRPACQ